MKHSSLLLLYMFVAGVVPAVADNVIDTIRVRRLDSVKVGATRISEHITSATPLRIIDETDMSRLNIVEWQASFYAITVVQAA